MDETERGSTAEKLACGSSLMNALLVFSAVITIKIDERMLFLHRVENLVQSLADRWFIELTKKLKNNF